MKTLLAAVSSILAIGGGLFYHSPLEAPGEKKVSVRSEIVRGARQYFAEVSRRPTEHLSQLPYRTDELLARYNAINSDSSGFVLGARFGEILVAAALLEPVHWPDNTPDDVLSAKTRARASLVEIDRLEKNLGITHEQAFEALGFPGESADFPKARIAELVGPMVEEPRFIHLLEEVRFDRHTVGYAGSRLRLIDRSGDSLFVGFEDGRYTVSMAQTDFRP